MSIISADLKLIYNISISIGRTKLVFIHKIFEQGISPFQMVGKLGIGSRYFNEMITFSHKQVENVQTYIEIINFKGNIVRNVCRGQTQLTLGGFGSFGSSRIPTSKPKRVESFLLSFRIIFDPERSIFIFACLRSHIFFCIQQEKPVGCLAPEIKTTHCKCWLSEMNAVSD